MKSLAAMRLGPAAEFEVLHWLGSLRGSDVDGSVLGLFRRACLARNGGPRTWHVCGARTPGPLPLTESPDWIVGVNGEDATLRCLPFGQAWQLDLSELLAVLLEWFDGEAPDVAASLRGVSGEDMRRAPRPRTAAASIAALAALATPSIAAVESALGVTLPLVRAGEGLQEHRATFVNGAFASATFFHDRQTDAAWVSLTPRVSSPESLDARELGWSARFDGFNFDRPGEVRRQFRADLGAAEVRVFEPSRLEREPVVMIDWKAVRRGGPLPACTSPPPGVPRLVGFGDIRTPGRYWLTMSHDGDGWIPNPAIKLPGGVAFRVELQNLAAFPGVGAHAHDRLRFHVDAVSRESRFVSGSEWRRETLFVNVIDVCVESAGA